MTVIFFRASVLIFVATILVIASTVTATFPVGPWHLGAHATFYGDDDGHDGNMGGACGYGDQDAALDPTLWGLHTAALSNVLFQDGQHCGACFELQCDNNGNDPSQWCLPQSPSVIVTATNNCPQGSFGGWCDAPHEHFDLSVPAFTSIAEKVGGVVPIQYRRVPCQRQGGIRFLIKGNPYFQLALVFNVGGSGDVLSLSVKGDQTSWLPAKRNWGENWQFGGYLVGQALSFCVTTFDNVAVQSFGVTDRNWAYGMTFEGAQFQ